MKKRILIIVVSILALVQPSLGEMEASEVVGTVSNVIVYRGQALVTRTIELDLAKGGSEIVVQQLPNQIVSESLYAQTSDDVTISSVRYRERAVKEDTREEVKQLDAEIERLTNQRRHASMKQELIEKNSLTLVKLENFTIAAKNSDLERGLLQFEPLEKLANYVETKRGEYHNEFVKLDDEIRELDKQLELLQRKRIELQAGRSRTEREAVLFINNPKAKKVAINLNYLVNGANWLPQYNLRAQTDKLHAVIEYNAVVFQASGEDWVGVEMSLSTAMPTMVAAAPVLQPIKVRIGPPVTIRRKGADYEQVAMPATEQRAYRDLSGQFQEMQKRRREVGRKGKIAQSELNALAASNQLMELQADKEDVQVIQKAAERFTRTEGVGVTYNLPGELTMPSRSDQQLLNITTFQAKADFIMIATPLMTDYVYLQGDITNDGDVILLAGPASMYCNGEFVGKTQIELVTIGEKFTAGFGVDSQIQISREFKDKKVDTLWGNRVEIYDYRIAIENYKNNKVKLRMFERIPYTKDEALEIYDFQTNTALSKDVDYLRTERDKGILRWDLNLAPNMTGKNAKVVTYTYAMKYDNDMQIRPAP
ncbi:MAG: mucoidy inhibitor MuiA family protein [Planctomycetota bacterium]